VPLRAQRIDDAPPDTARFELVLPSKLDLIADAVEVVTDCCHRQYELSRTTRFRLCTIASEVLTNAMSYGNGNDPSRRVTIHLEVRSCSIVLSVTDEGTGFDPEDVPDLHEGDCHNATRGRGLFIIRELAEKVVFNDRGNTIWVTLPIQ
jgi:serine/threonine-protein kinase RsbW